MRHVPACGTFTPPARADSGEGKGKGKGKGDGEGEGGCT